MVGVRGAVEEECVSIEHGVYWRVQVSGCRGVTPRVSGCRSDGRSREYRNVGGHKASRIASSSPNMGRC